MGDPGETSGGRANPVEVEVVVEARVVRVEVEARLWVRRRRVRIRGQDAPIEEEGVPRFDFLAARFSLRLCWAFFFSPFFAPLSLFATVASSASAPILVFRVARHSPIACHTPGA